MKVFFLGSETASDVTFGLIVVKDFLDFSRKSGVQLLEPLGYILMYRGF